MSRPAPLPRRLARLSLPLLALVLGLVLAGCNPPPPPKTHLKLTTVPAQAQATIDGQSSVATTPLDIAIPTGGHRLEIRADGYRPAWVDVPDTAGPVELHVALQPVTAPLKVTSLPTGAIVRLDGDDVGTTPLRLPAVSTGDHRLELQLTGYAPHTVTVTIPSGRPQQVDVDMASVMGTVLIASRPGGAQIFIDGNAKGNTPETPGEYVSISGLQEGAHQLVLRQRHHLDLTTNFQVERNGTTQIPIQTLTEMPGGVTLETTPAGALIYRDGENVGKTPKTFADLQPGTYDFRLEMAGFTSHTETVVISPGITKNVVVDLSTTTGSLMLTTEPPGCVVLLNRELIGRTVAGDNDVVSAVLEKHAIEPGRYVLEIQHPKYETKRLAVVVTRGETVNLQKIALEPLFIPTHKVTIRNTFTNKQTTYEGILLRDDRPEGGIEFRSDKNTVTTYKAEEVVNVTKLRSAP